MREALRDAASGLVDREHLLELVALATVAREHLLVVGPPGTAKSEAVRRIAVAFRARTFEYLVGRFTEPNELFGPVDLRRLREGVVETRTEGMLPEAEFAFLDEIFLGSTSILNTLLGLLNDRVFRRGHTALRCPLRACVGASNAIPEDPALAAFSDRFLLRVYRLLARGLPAHPVGREWRFDRAEVLRWVDGGAPRPDPAPAEPIEPVGAPPLIAANGDVAVERLLQRVGQAGALLGFVPADRDRGLALLGEARVLAAGCHGSEPPRQLGIARLARIHVVVREVGLVTRRESPAPDSLRGRVLAGRPATAGIRVHLRGVDLAGAELLELDSHRDVVHAVARGDADVGLTTRAWGDRLGLAFARLASEDYGLVLRASDLGDPRIVRLCEVAQSAAFRAELAAIAG